MMGAVSVPCTALGRSWGGAWLSKDGGFPVGSAVRVVSQAQIPSPTSPGRPLLLAPNEYTSLIALSERVERAVSCFLSGRLGGSTQESSRCHRRHVTPQPRVWRDRPTGLRRLLATRIKDVTMRNTSSGQKYVYRCFSSGGGAPRRRDEELGYPLFTSPTNHVPTVVSARPAGGKVRWPLQINLKGLQVPDRHSTWCRAKTGPTASLMITFILL